MMMAGHVRPHFSLGERNGRARSKRDIGGGFRDSPSKPPLKTTKRGGCGPLFGNFPHGAAAGREAERFDKHPRNLRKRDNLRHKRGWTGALQRTRMELGKSAESWLSAVASPNLPGRASLDQAAFSSTVHGAFFFAKTKKNGG